MPKLTIRNFSINPSNIPFKQRPVRSTTLAQHSVAIVRIPIQNSVEGQKVIAFNRCMSRDAYSTELS